MPSDRFKQLKQVKKKAFLKMAYQEFAFHAYEGASITRLVSNLKMAKGSIYQYFDDKEDLYNFLVLHAQSQLHSLLKQACPLPKTDTSFHVWYKNFMLIHMKFFTSLPSYGLLLLRNQMEKTGSNVNTSNNSIYSYLLDALEKSGQTLSNEKMYHRFILSFIIFKYVLDTSNEDLVDLIEDKKHLNISSDQLLNLCDGFID